LQESREADLQLHVIDLADPRLEDNIKQVQKVLHEIEADDLPQLFVYNKIDVLQQNARIEYDESGTPVAVYLSAQSGDGLNLLTEAIVTLLSDSYQRLNLALPPDAASWRARFHEMGAVQQEHFDEQGVCLLQIALAKPQWERLLKQSDGLLQNFIVST
jgi:GTP-binding protein HflX